jgi:DNA invertase Pin-like site-specific DNA recombinase
MDAEAIACVIYAAKSTEDLRGSLPDQLHQCREAVHAESGREIVGEYADEAFSAYTGSRGPALREAMEHLEELAARDLEAELWALHSDRLARGDGRVATHAVEIALWALKRNVRVRTLQDPDTFRDLLYAVVTGQRNHEDSRRKGLAISGGHRRAAQRGEPVGSRADGYRLVVEVDGQERVTKHLELDPNRQPAIEMIFRLALKGKRTGAIARALNDAGWRTKPQSRKREPLPWTCGGVLGILGNARYAGVATLKGEIIGPAQWPAYITLREHKRIKAQLGERRPTKRYRQLETYLLARFSHCGLCGAPMHSHTGAERDDGTFARRYVCSGHSRGRHAGRCSAPRIDADVVEAMLVSALGTLLGGEQFAPSPAAAYPGTWTRSKERSRVLEAVSLGDDDLIDDALEHLAARMRAGGGVSQTRVGSSPQTRRLDAVKRIQAWAETGISDRTQEWRARTAEMRKLLRGWFCDVTIAMDGRGITVAAHHHPIPGERAVINEVRFSRREWRRFSPLAQRTKRTYVSWPESEILGALQRWADSHGYAPRSSDWTNGTFEHPSSLTVRKHLTSWARALRLAGLTPRNPRAVRIWTDDEILQAIQMWTIRHGRAPHRDEWMRGTPRRPCRTTVCNHFGTWPAALAAADRPKEVVAG